MGAVTATSEWTAPRRVAATGGSSRRRQATPPNDFVFETRFTLMFRASRSLGSTLAHHQAVTSPIVTTTGSRIGSSRRASPSATMSCWPKCCREAHRRVHRRADLAVSCTQSQPRLRSVGTPTSAWRHRQLGCNRQEPRWRRIEAAPRSLTSLSTRTSKRESTRSRTTHSGSYSGDLSRGDRVIPVIGGQPVSAGRPSRSRLKIAARSVCWLRSAWSAWAFRVGRNSTVVW
jgi:hypothetical protein